MPAISTAPALPVPAAEVHLHSRRAAAVANLVAHQLFLPTEEKELLQAACLAHHPAAPEAPEVLGILDACQTPGSGTDLQCKLAGILRLTDAFDRDMEAPDAECREPGEILGRLRGGVSSGLWAAESLDALAHAIRPTPIEPAERWNVPVFPAALRTFRLMRDPRAGLREVVEAAQLDPATAGLVVQLANSALYGSLDTVSTLSHAIGRLGFAVAQRVILSAAMRPVFGSPKLHEVWLHSLQAADLAEQLAVRSGSIDPGEAYLAGLLHDTGRIALLAMPLYDSARMEGLVCGGCPRVYAERVLLHTDHAGLGAKLAAWWRLPEFLVAAIGQHHRPEHTDSQLARLLYVTECLTDSDEDLPSAIRLESCLDAIALSWDDLATCSLSDLGAWLTAA